MQFIKNYSYKYYFEILKFILIFRNTAVLKYISLIL